MTAATVNKRRRDKGLVWEKKTSSRLRNMYLTKVTARVSPYRTCPFAIDRNPLLSRSNKLTLFIERKGDRRKIVAPTKRDTLRFLYT